MHAAGKRRPFWASPDLPHRVHSLIVLAAVRIRRPAIRLGGWKLVVVLGVGLGDTLGNVLFAGAASQGGLESLTSVLASLYPIVTVMLAALVLHERHRSGAAAGRVARARRDRALISV